MRMSIVFVLSLVSLSFLPNVASAGFKATVTEVRLSCSKSGGTFEVHKDGKGYGCIRKNCDGKGGNCIVACDNNNNCNSSTPKAAKSISPTKRS